MMYFKIKKGYKSECTVLFIAHTIYIYLKIGNLHT